MKKIILSLILLTFFVSFGNFVFADDEVKGDPKIEVTGDPKSTTNLPNPLGVTNPSVLIGKVISGALGVVGSFALLMFIYGGFMWMLSAGNEEMVKKGRSTLTWAALGLIVIFTSYILVKFIIDKTTGS